MDEGTRTGGPSVGEHERGPAEIREEIAKTREELGETVEALAAKTDVKRQAKAKVQDTKEQLRTKLDAVKERVGATADGAAVHAPASAREGAQQITSTAANNPAVVAMIGAFAAGLLLGLLIGRRRR